MYKESKFNKNYLNNNIKKSFLQKKNVNFWENNPMTYDWTEDKPKKIDLNFFETIDKRFTNSIQKIFDNEKYFIENFLKKKELKKLNVLEIGTGMGCHSEILSKNSKKFTGIDITITASKITKKRFKIKKIKGLIHKMDAEKLTFKNNTFDLIWSWGVIHHSSNTEKILNQIHRVLKPGGQAVIMIYYKSWWSYYVFGFFFYGILKRDFLRYKNIFDIINSHSDGAIARFYSINEWNFLIKRNKLDIEYNKIFGLKSDIFPIPKGKIKNLLISLTPSFIFKFLITKLSMGSFLVSSIKKLN